MEHLWGENDGLFLYLLVCIRDEWCIIIEIPGVCTCLSSGRAVEEQLLQLTRLVLRLPEVEGLLQRAGLQPPASRTEPTAALEIFVKVKHRAPEICQRFTLILHWTVQLRASDSQTRTYFLASSQANSNCNSALPILCILMDHCILIHIIHKMCTNILN